jgi:hypothetical protein
MRSQKTLNNMSDMRDSLATSPAAGIAREAKGAKRSIF